MDCASFKNPESLNLPTVSDKKLLGGDASLCAELPHALHHFHALSNPAKSHMLEVQVFGLFQCDEELRIVGIATAVCHGQDAWTRVTDVEVLILELGAIDGFPACAVAVGDVAALWEPGKTLVNGMKTAEIQQIEICFFFFYNN